MKTLVLNTPDILAIHDALKLKDSMAAALRFLSEGQAQNFSRHAINIKDDAALGFMPATFAAGNLYGYKTVTVFANNKQHGLNPHQGFVVLLNGENGMIKAILDGSTVTALRTAAVSAVATEKLSRADSKILAVIGAGRQAFEHVFSISEVRPIEKVVIWNRNRDSTEKLIVQLRTKLNCDFEIAPTPQKAVAHADIVVTCTSSSEALFNIEDVRAGTHINAIGACRPGFAEIELFDREGLQIFMDSQAACLLEAAEITRALSDGKLSCTAFAGEIGDYLLGKIKGRTNKNQITFFKSVGLGVEDLFAANCFFNLALEKNIGTQINFGGLHE